MRRCDPARRSKGNPTGEISGHADDERAFTEKARCAQLVRAAIAVLAEVGYEQASLARIAAAARVSKGVICYHFAGQDGLLREIVRGYVRRAGPCG